MELERVIKQTKEIEMVGINEITCTELSRWIAEFAVGSDAYICAMDELAFRARNPEYKVAG